MKIHTYEEEATHACREEAVHVGKEAGICTRNGEAEVIHICKEEGEETRFFEGVDEMRARKGEEIRGDMEKVISQLEEGFCKTRRVAEATRICKLRVAEIRIDKPEIHPFVGHPRQKHCPPLPLPLTD